MAGSKHICESEAKKIWFLHEKGMKPTEIAFATDRGVNSVYRVIDIFIKTAGGEFEALERRYGRTNKNLLILARAHFGIEHQAEPEPEKPQPVRNNTAIFLGEVLSELRRNNELLQKLCEVWGVQL